MQECITHVSSGLESLMMIRARVEGVRDSAHHAYKKTFFNRRGEEIRSHNLAVNQALEIIDAIEARFIIGQADKEPRPLRDSKWWLYEDENLFK